MVHKIKNVYPMDGTKVNIQFMEGVTKIYDVTQLFYAYPTFKKLEDPKLFNSVKINDEGDGIIFSKGLEIDSDDLYMFGTKIDSPFDGIISFSEAAKLWNLNDSTLRKAISYGKFQKGIDISKFGKDWVVTIKAMIREYGKPKY